MAIRAAMFDYAGVMTEDMNAAFHQVALEAGVPPGDLSELLLGDYSGTGEVNPWHQVERGEIPLSDLVEWGRRKGAERGWDVDLAALMRGFMALPVRPGMVELVRGLRTSGVRTALVTNNAREFAPEWRPKLPLDEIFDEVVDSHEVGLRKPDPAIFLLTLERLGATPEESVLLDDITVNLDAARALGMHAIHVAPDSAPAIAELRALLAQDGPTSPSRVTR